MKIDRVDVFVAEHRLSEPFGFSQWWYAERTAVLVRVTADDGTVGWGECYGSAEVNAAVVREFMAPRLVGRDPFACQVIWEELYNRSRDFGRTGAFVAGLSGVDIALWDLKGRALGVSVATLLGGAWCQQVRAYATGMYFTRGADQPARLADEARRYVDEGFGALKMKVGIDVATDLRHLRAVRRAIGHEVLLAIDANHAYCAREAIELGLHAAGERIWWFEEPVAPEDYDGYAEVRRVLASEGVPIAGGEAEYTRFGFRELCARRCVDLAQPDLCAAGGFTGGLQIATIANVHGIQLQPHTWGSAVSLAAALQFIVALPPLPGALTARPRWVEYDRTENPLRDELVPGFPDRRGDLIRVPDGPGLGIDIDVERLKRYCSRGA